MRAGSVVGSPFAFSPVPGGTVLPSRAAICTSPMAIAAVAMSNTIGSRPGRGQAKEIGLVPNSAARAPAGATAGM